MSFASVNHSQGDRYYGNRLGLTMEQKMKIKRLNQEMGLQFAAIGKDPSLRGYEKGQKKRALAMKKREAIYKILKISESFLVKMLMRHLKCHIYMISLTSMMICWML